MTTLDTITDEPPIRRLAEIYRENGAYPDHWKKKRDPLSRPFIAWDGEGITFDGSVVQSYVLFGNSEGRSLMVTSECSLSTVQCFDLLLDAERECPEAIHVGFALKYDCNMMFRDIPRPILERIYNTGRGKWRDYRIDYRPGKWLGLSKGNTTIRLFDVFGFFQSSFVVAIAKFLGNTSESLQISQGKAARSTFTFDELKTVILPYWKSELKLLVRLMEALRNDLHLAGIDIASWHGPGAVANTVFRTHKIQNHKEAPPPVVNRAAQYAYAGGRFELFKCGHYEGKVWEYDINSAYPDAIRRLPSLSGGRWERTTEFEPGSFGVWNVAYNDNSSDRWFRPHPFFCRHKNGAVAFQDLVIGWYWTPECELQPNVEIRGGYVFRPDGDRRPFAFVADMYRQRREWKRAGNSAERAYKLALNSLYGKMAQRIGWQEGRNLPTWHQLEWAGFVTSSVRRKIWNAIQQNPQAIIAVETDAVFSTEPLDLPIGDELGEWSVETFDWITYLQNGVYWAGQNGEIVDRYRGYDKGSLPYDSVLAALRNSEPITGRTTRFIGLGLGLHTKAVWNSWETEDRALSIGGGGKRSHVDKICPSCKAGIGLADGLHPLVMASGTGRSHPHSLPWMVGAEAELRAMDERERW